MYYFRFLNNFIKLFTKKIFYKASIKGSLLQSFGKHTEIIISKNAYVNFGRNIQSDGFCRIIAGKNSKLSIGEGTYFNNGCVVSSMKNITIGSHCLFGPNVAVFDNNHKFSADKGVSYEHTCDDIEIGDNCWIAANVIILKGTKIGCNCVIGAGTKVSGEVPDGTIVT